MIDMILHAAIQWLRKEDKVSLSVLPGAVMGFESDIRIVTDDKTGETLVILARHTANFPMGEEEDAGGEH